jgi:ATP citrate (pro-S)-lyase
MQVCICHMSMETEGLLDTISDLGYGSELANYGEYSGDPSEDLTHEYAKTILDLMTRSNSSRTN